LEKKNVDATCWAQTGGVPVGQRRRLIFTVEVHMVEAVPGAEPEQVEYRQLLNLKENKFPN